MEEQHKLAAKQAEMLALMDMQAKKQANLEADLMDL